MSPSYGWGFFFGRSELLIYAAMRTADFKFDLPEALIAQWPLSERSASRLLCLNGETGNFQSRKFIELPELLSKDDLLVFNDTRVIPARLRGRKDSGGKVECLIERVVSERHAHAQVRASKPPKAGSKILLEDGTSLSIIDRAGEFYNMEFPENVLSVLERCGHIPLPPYINRDDELSDRERYQTLFANQPGAVAAPTAGLHFDDQVLEAMSKKKIRTTCLTLHIGAGTFQPVRVDDISDHIMHSEWYSANDDVVNAIIETRQRKGRVVAVGTTVVRTLETLAKIDPLRAASGETDIFITPGYRFRCVDAMITNFHLPESTLLMLVCAFAGKKKVLAAYRHAVGEQYRFFSYGDAMFITPDSKARQQ